MTVETRVETLFDVPELPPELDTLGRIRALESDPRARFLPTTHLEKNWALSLLDYIDILDPADELRKPDKGHPARTAGQLNEVFRYHQKLQWKKFDATPEIFENNREQVKKKGIEEGQRAMRSIAFEFGDFLRDSLTQAELLKQFNKDVDDCPNPRVSLEEELGSEHPGIAPFARFFDLYDFRRTGISPVHGYDLLRTKEVRQNVEEPDRNKYIEDPYTATELDPAMQDRINYVGRTFTIGATRKIITKGNLSLAQAALKGQHNRANFWMGRLREARLHGAARPIAERVLTNLGIQIR